MLANVAQARGPVLAPSQNERMPPLTTPTRGGLEAGSSYAAPFGLLAACHERVQRSLDLLLRLLAHALSQGPDRLAQDAAADVLRYFDIAAPLHHQDEERHVFPALPGDPRCQRLIAQHREIDTQWQALRAGLQDLARLDAAQLLDLEQQAQAFAALHEAHLRCEDELVFPAAAVQLDAAAQQAMGSEMAARRGLRLKE